LISLRVGETSDSSVFTALRRPFSGELIVIGQLPVASC
jgi:hypothetical protein